MSWKSFKRSKNTRRSKSFGSGLITGAIISLIVALSTQYLQHVFSLSERQSQLIIDEKKEFISACNDYLKEYRNWHELMNYFVSYDDTTQPGVRDFQNTNEGLLSYIKWRKDFDYAYGKVYLYSNSDFGHSTMLTSTVIHYSIRALIDYELDSEVRRNILNYGDLYFNTYWLEPVKREIFDYNRGRLKFENFEDYSQKSRRSLTESLSDSTFNDLFLILNELYPEEPLFQ